MNIQNLPIKKSAINPLWIITMFFLFSELMLGYAVTQTTKNIQLILTIFVISFPPLVSLAFFLILWHKPKHLYAPTDYQTDQSFLESLRESQNMGKLDKQIKSTIDETLNSDKIVSKLKNENPQTVLRQTANEIVEKIRKDNFISIDLNGFTSDKDQNFIVPYENFQMFSELTDVIYFKLENVRVFAYGYDWVLRFADTNEIIKNSRMIINAPPGEPTTDTRKLEEVGINPGTRLIVTKP